MAIAKQRIMPCLWFATEAEEAANFYCSIFKDSPHQPDQPLRQRGLREAWQTARLGYGGRRISVLRARTVALNGGPQFKFSEAISFQIHCET